VLVGETLSSTPLRENCLLGGLYLWMAGGGGGGGGVWGVCHIPLLEGSIAVRIVSFWGWLARLDGELCEGIEWRSSCSSLVRAVGCGELTGEI